MRYLLIIILLIFPNQQDEKYISWSKDYKLKWSDFQGVSDREDPVETLTEAFTYVNISIHSKSVGGKMSFEVKCLFIKDMSFVSGKDRSQELLQHEQIHFDLSEVYARKLRQYLSQLDSSSYKSRRSMIQEILKEREYDQELYDQETSHGLNREKQLEWEKSIRMRLQQLEEYSSKQ
jgi:hypothetical protein